MTKKEKFNSTYKEELRKVVLERPEEYRWPISQLDEVCRRMFSAFETGSFNKDGLAIKRTCKKLGIKYTYRDIESFSRSNDEVN